MGTYYYPGIGLLVTGSIISTISFLMILVAIYFWATDNIIITAANNNIMPVIDAGEDLTLGLLVKL